MPSSAPNPASRLAIIIAMAKNRTIGVDNTQPWCHREVTKYFKALTMGASHEPERTGDGNELAFIVGSDLMQAGA